MKRNTRDELKVIGINIRRFRKAQGMNLVEFATKTGSTPTNLSNLENGSNKNPSWDLLDRVASILNTTIHQLTMRDTSAHPEFNGSVVSKALVELLKDQDRILGSTEDRISLGEAAWLKTIPVENPDQVNIDELLLLLRFIRNLNSRMKPSDSS